MKRQIGRLHHQVPYRRAEGLQKLYERGRRADDVMFGDRPGDGIENADLRMKSSDVDPDDQAAAPPLFETWPILPMDGASIETVRILCANRALHFSALRGLNPMRLWTACLSLSVSELLSRARCGGDRQFRAPRRKATCAPRVQIHRARPAQSRR
jgi:hypothetical protein